jgi:hypothetical protein
MNGPWKIVIVLAGAFIVMRVLGLELSDIDRMVTKRLDKAATDTRDLANGAYAQRTAERLRSEADSLPVPDAGATGDVDEMNRELQVERKRLLKERAEIAEKSAGHMLRGDIDSLKRQAEQNARMAGGGTQ